jgi:hypothetical protein
MQIDQFVVHQCFEFFDSNIEFNRINIPSSSTEIRKSIRKIFILMIR